MPRPAPRSGLVFWASRDARPRPGPPLRRHHGTGALQRRACPASRSTAGPSSTRTRWKAPATTTAGPGIPARAARPTSPACSPRSAPTCTRSPTTRSPSTSTATARPASTRIGGTASTLDQTTRLPLGRRHRASTVQPEAPDALRRVAAHPRLGGGRHASPSTASRSTSRPPSATAMPGSSASGSAGDRLALDLAARAARPLGQPAGPAGCRPRRRDARPAGLLRRGGGQRPWPQPHRPRRDAAAARDRRDSPSLPVPSRSTFRSRATGRTGATTLYRATPPRTEPGDGAPRALPPLGQPHARRDARLAPRPQSRRLKPGRRTLPHRSRIIPHCNDPASGSVQRGLGLTFPPGRQC